MHCFSRRRDFNGSRSCQYDIANNIIDARTLAYCSFYRLECYAGVDSYVFTAISAKGTYAKYLGSCLTQRVLNGLVNSTLGFGSRYNSNYFEYIGYQAAFRVRYVTRTYIWTTFSITIGLMIRGALKVNFRLVASLLILHDRN